MITTVHIKVNANAPSLPLAPFALFEGSALTVKVEGVPRPVGKQKVDAVSVAVKNAEGETQSVAAVLSGGLWTATFEGSHFASSGFVGKGVTVIADGTDEHGDAVEGWILGKGDLMVMEADGTVRPGEVVDEVRWYDVAPESPRKGDVAPVNGTISLWDGEEWRVLGGGSTTVSWGDIEGDLADQGDLASELARKLSTSAKLSDLHDESGNPTTENKVMLKTDGGLESQTKVYNGTITLDHLSEDFVAYDYNGDPYLSKPPTGAWKGPFGPFPESTNNYSFFVPSSYDDPTTESETVAEWCIWINGSNASLMYRATAAASLGSINQASFASQSASEPAPYAIVGQAFFTRASTTQTKTFATTEAVSGKLDKSGGEMTVPIEGGYKIKFVGGTSGQNDGVAIVDSTGRVVVLLGVQSGQLCVVAPNFYGGAFDGTKYSISGGYTTLESGKITQSGHSLLLPTVSGTFALLNNILALCQPFSATKSGGYAVGEFCSRLDGDTLKLYQCTTTHTGAWNAAHFAERDVASLFSIANTALAATIKALAAPKQDSDGNYYFEVETEEEA